MEITMKQPKQILTLLLAATFVLLATSTASAQDPAEGSNYRDFSSMPVSGTMSFEVTSVKLIAGASWGEGTLSYQGKDYPIKVKSLSAGGIGYRTMKGEGKVYDLNRLEDFPGIYGGGTAGATAANAGGGVATLENSKRVVIQAEVTDSEGLQLSLSAGGIQIEFADN
jgi:hypothetical protein